MKRSLAGRRILLTGGSRGIGRAMVTELLNHGAHLALVGRNEAALWEALGGAAGWVKVVDFSEPRDIEALADEAARALGGLDGLVSCAGVVHYEPLMDLNPVHVSEQMQVNLLSPLSLATAAARVMEPGGDMLFVASTLGLRPAHLTAVYAASKAALISLSRSFALELGPRGIRVNALLPGVIETDMINVLRPDPPAESSGELAEKLAQQHRELAALHPLQRLGRPEEVAEAAIYLLQSNFVTGTLLTVDGGLSLGT